MKNIIDPYNEEIWEDNSEKNWIIIGQINGWPTKSKNKYTYEEAIRLCEKWNKECDAYTSYRYIKII